MYGVRRSSRKRVCPFWLPLQTLLILYKYSILNWHDRLFHADDIIEAAIPTQQCGQPFSNKLNHQDTLLPYRFRMVYPPIEGISTSEWCSTYSQILDRESGPNFSQSQVRPLPLDAAAESWRNPMSNVCMYVWSSHIAVYGSTG